MFVSGSWDEGLDGPQLDAATHGDTPLVVLAGAGTGKTRTLTARVACLLHRGVPATSILLLTFTRRAASEMLGRARDLAGGRRGEQPLGGTFHSVAHRHVAAYAEVLDVPKAFGVLDPPGSCDLMDMLREDHGLAGTAGRVPRAATLVEIYSRCINNGRTLRDLLPAEYPWCEPHLEAIAGLFRAFGARKRRAGLLDFDDLLLAWRALLAEPALGPQLAAKFRYVLVDEYQDVNALQVDIVRGLAPAGKGLTVVGDEAQAIYGFRGADPGHLGSLVGAFPDSTVVRLECNFRSRQAVLDVANAVRPTGDGAIRLRAERGGGPRPQLLRCYDAASEARCVAEQILEAHERGVQLRHQAVLVRAAHHSDLVEVELSLRKVPYRKYGGLRFLEAAHVKDFVAAARLVENPSDEVAWFRLLRLHRGIGPSRARSLIEVVHPAADALARWPEVVAAAPPATRAGLSTSMAGLVEARRRTTPGSRAEAVFDVVKPLLQERYDDAPVRLGDLERLVGAAGAVEDLSAWLADLTLDPPVSTSDLAAQPHLDEDYVVISTIHSAKGLEWPVVHLPHLVDGALPLDMALKSADGLAEERRLLYVAVTRARDELYLYAPLRMPHHRHALDDRHSFAPLSRFLDDSVIAAVDVRQERSPPLDLSAPSAAQAEAGKVVVDLDALWS